jgi:serine phosphatase RsbU (regulator of sigma subunit)
MCLAMLKITKNKLVMSSAGMPSIYIYRKEKGIVEEFEFQGMPLGTLENFPYKSAETEINSGDTIFLTSDGFPELKNANNEMFGYKRVRSLFENLANESPEAMISKLKDTGSDWVNDKDPDDDVTFVVIKVK